MSVVGRVVAAVDDAVVFEEMNREREIAREIVHTVRKRRVAKTETCGDAGGNRTTFREGIIDKATLDTIGKTMWIQDTTLSERLM